MCVEREELDLSVIFPCLNEAECVGQCVRDAKAFMEEENIRGEVLVVDNGSRDDSARQARSCGARVLYEKDTGYGNAIRCGLSKSRGQVVIFADCDMTYDVHRLWRLYEPLKRGEADIVIGDRFRGGSKIKKGYTFTIRYKCLRPVHCEVGKKKYRVYFSLIRSKKVIIVKVNKKVKRGKYIIKISTASSKYYKKVSKNFVIRIR